MIVEGDVAVFGVGVAGAVANEILHWYGLRENPNLPVYLKSPFYWLVSGLMILLGGALAWLQLGNTADGLIAFQIGLAAPMVLQNLSKAVPASRGAQGTKPSLHDFFRG